MDYCSSLSRRNSHSTIGGVLWLTQWPNPRKSEYYYGQSEAWERIAARISLLPLRSMNETPSLGGISDGQSRYISDRAKESPISVIPSEYRNNIPDEQNVQRVLHSFQTEEIRFAERNAPHFELHTLRGILEGGGSHIFLIEHINLAEERLRVQVFA